MSQVVGSLRMAYSQWRMENVEDGRCLLIMLRACREVAIVSLGDSPPQSRRGEGWLNITSHLPPLTGYSSLAKEERRCRLYLILSKSLNIHLNICIVNLLEVNRTVFLEKPLSPHSELTLERVASQGKEACFLGEAPLKNLSG